MITIIRKKNTIQYESKSVLVLRVSPSTGTWVQDFFVFNFINKMCIYNVYDMLRCEINAIMNYTPFS